MLRFGSQPGDLPRAFLEAGAISSSVDAGEPLPAAIVKPLASALRLWLLCLSIADGWSYGPGRVRSAHNEWCRSWPASGRNGW
jgi:hypothetical protein